MAVTTMGNESTCRYMGKSRTEKMNSCSLSGRLGHLQQLRVQCNYSKRSIRSIDDCKNYGDKTEKATLRSRGHAFSVVSGRGSVECFSTTMSTQVETELVPASTMNESRAKLASGKPRVVVLGSGWGAIAYLKALEKNAGDIYDITVVSPRNYFLYTPLLPGAATGAIEGRQS